MIQNVHHPFPTSQQCRAFIHWRICFSSFVSSSPSFTANSSAADKTCLGQEWKQKANTITKNRPIYLGLFVQKSRCQQNITTDDWCLAKKKNGPAWNNKPAPITTTPKLIPVPLLPIASSGTPFPDDPRLNRRLVWLILAYNSYHTKMNEMPSLRKALQRFSAKQVNHHVNYRWSKHYCATISNKFLVVVHPKH